MSKLFFNGSTKDSIYLLRGRSKSPFHPVSREFKGRDYRLKKRKKELLEISQPIGFRVDEDVEQINIIEELTNWLITEEWGILSFEDEPGRSYLAVLQNDMSDFEKIARLRQGTLQFIAKATLGKEVKLNLSPTTQTFTIAGQESTPWKSRTRFSVPQSSYTLESNVGKVLLEYDFIAGDVLEIDYDKRDVRLNGKDLAFSVLLETVWAELPVGEVSLKASQPTELTYSERYY